MDLEVRENKYRRTNMDNDRMVFTVKETANILNVNVHLVYNLIREGLLPALKLGSLKIRKEAIQKFLIDYEGMDLTDLKNIVKLNTTNMN